MVVRHILKHRVVRNSAVVTVGFVVTGILGYLFQFLISRHLSVEHYGEFQTLIALFGVFGVLSAVVSYAVIARTSVFAVEQDAAANRAFLRSITTRLLPITGLLTAVVLFLSPTIQRMLHLSAAWGVSVAGIMALFSLLTVTLTGTLTGWQAFLPLNVGIIASACVKLTAGLLIVLAVPRAETLMLALFASALTTWGIAQFSVRRVLTRATRARSALSAHAHSRPSPQGTARGGDLRFVVMFTLLVMLLQNGDMLLVKHLVSPTIAGHYGALNILGKMVLWVNLGIAMVILPAAIARAHVGRRVETRLRLYASGVMLVFGLSAMGLFLIAPAILTRLLFGPAYALFSQNLWLLGMMNLLLSLLLLEMHFAYARRDRRILLMAGLTVLCLLFSIALFHDTIRSLTLAGIVSFALGYLGTLTVNLWRSKSTLPIMNPATHPEIMLETVAGDSTPRPETLTL